LSEKLEYPIAPSKIERSEAMTPTDIRIKSGNTEAVISPEMGGLVSVFSIDGENILYENSEAYNDPNQRKIKAGIPVLFPYAGPRKGGIQHGGAREVPVWTWETSTENSVTLSLDSDHIKDIKLPSMVKGEKVGEFDGTITVKKIIDGEEKTETQDIVGKLEELYGLGYRFDFEMKITVSEGSLRYDFKIKNLSGKDMPFAPGLHPYFKVDHTKRSEIKTNLENFDLASSLNDNTQVAERPNDGRVFVTLPDETKIEIDSSPEFKKFVGYAETDESDYICIEPFVARPSSPEKDEIMIKYEETKELFVEFRVSKENK